MNLRKRKQSPSTERPTKRRSAPPSKAAIATGLAPLGLTCKAMEVMVGAQSMEELVKLREENALLKSVVKATQEQASHFSEKYERLVWFARTDPSARTDRSHPGHKSYKDVLKMYPNETNISTWDHGFNSGLLAGSRLFAEFSATEPWMPNEDDEDEDEDEESRPGPRSLSARLAGQRELALEEFPMLDT